MKEEESNENLEEDNEEVTEDLDEESEETSDDSEDSEEGDDSEESPESKKKIASRTANLKQNEDSESEHLDEWTRTDKTEESKKKEEEEEEEDEEDAPLIKKEEKGAEEDLSKELADSGVQIYALRTTANREDQVMDFVSSNAAKKKLGVFSVIRPHGMRGYIFVEASTRSDAEQAAFNVPYARGLLPSTVDYKEIAHMLEQVKVQMNIKKNDVVEIISGPFKREQAKVTRIDRGKEDVVVELLEAAVPIPITVKMDAVRVIRREEAEKEEEDDGEDDL